MFKPRPERPDEHAQIFQLNLVAFNGRDEAELGDRLRAVAEPFISLVVAHEDHVVGHICFTPVKLESAGSLAMMGLAPMAVHPDFQGQGIGTSLIRTGLEVCRQQKIAAVVVLGHADYYPRFGFLPASKFALKSTYAAPDETFMALELTPGPLAEVAGMVHYHPAFEGV